MSPRSALAFAALAVVAAALCWPWHGGRRRGSVVGVWIRPESQRRRSLRRVPGRRARERDRSADVAAALELLAVAVSGGSGLVQALELLAGHSPPCVRRDLVAVAAGVRWGWPWDRAWRAVGPEWEPARRAFVVAEAAGAPPAYPLAAAARDLRREQLRQLDERAARLGVRLVLPLGVAFLPAFVLVAVVPLVLALAVDAWQ